MSKSQLRNCGNKRRFTSKVEAVAAAAEKKLGVYVCPVCSGFHLTSQVAAKSGFDKKTSIEPEKPIFDGSLMARARFKRSG